MSSKIALFPVLLLVDFAWATSGCAASRGQAPTQPSRDQRPTNATAGSSNVGCAVAADPDGPGTSAWAFIDDTGTLSYGALPQGDRLLDYSYAGYGGGGVAIPWATTQQSVTPSGGDDTAAIQDAIDAVSQLTPGDDGLRGAVQLAFGTFHLEGSISVRTSGVVL